MRNKYFILILIGIIAGFLFFGCDINREKKVEDAEENVRAANQELKDAQVEYDKEWRQFRSDAELKINANEKSIDTLKTEMKTADKKFRAKYEKEVAALGQKNIELKKKIIDYKYEGKNKWGEFKKGFNQDLDIVAKAIKDIFAKKN
jgi:hypothetical protein